MLITKSLVLIAGVAQVYAATTTSSSYVAQFSPVFPDLPTATGVVTSYNPGPYDTSPSLPTTKLSGFPPTFAIPPTDSAEVKAAYNSIDWSKVPKAPVRKQNSDGSWNFGSDTGSDPYCWWTDTNCVKPKVSYLPPDIYTCPNDGDWGLTYDDGPFNLFTDSNAGSQNDYAEPALYNFLTKTNQKSTFFYIGSNVANYPAAAKRGLNDGHHLCVHTWSHQPMTTLTNAQIVAELYWGLKVIKGAAGVTSKCWRPPQGDVDDRVRSIAWQMGMRTVLWDHDTNDWDIPGPNGGGGTPAKKVDSYFQGWINAYNSGKDKSGHIVLEHELNKATVNMSMFWMPRIQKVFNVIPALACNGISQPYWEKNFVYPLTNSRDPATTTTSATKTTTTTTATTTTTKTITTTATATATPTCVAGSYGLRKGDGYKGYCCKTEADCKDDCVSGKCNGPVNTKTATTAKTTTTGKTTTTKTTTTKANTTKTTTTTAAASCTPGSRGKKKGDGKTGYCCSSSDDCVETCRKNVCGL